MFPPADFKAHLPAKNEDGEWTEELTATWYELKCVHSGKRYRDAMVLLALRLSRSGPSSSVASPSPSSTLSTSPTTERERARSVPWRLTWIPCPTRAWSLVTSVKPAAIPRGCVLLGMAARAQQVGRVYRGGKCAPQEIALLYRYLVHRVTVHAGKAILTRMRFAHPHRSTSRCAEHVVRNVGDIVGDAPQRTAYADITNSPLRQRRSLGPRLMASPLDLQ